MKVQWFFGSFVLMLIFLSNYGSTQFYNNKPYPTYSLESMPNTGFSCRDKILGGYYADSETQCQMFHVCVKVAGFGVQDFRFLCPNGTAFDQDAQICAEWEDVDCEATTLYYSSDNFDLYRIGSGFETKSAFPGEEESAFHLQRADTGDIRLQKEQRINQKPEYNLQNNKPRPTQKSYTNTNDREIFRGASSSNFFNNRNGGKEDDYETYDNVGSARNEVPKDPKPVKKIIRRPSISQTTVQSNVPSQNPPSTTTLKPTGFKRIQPRQQTKIAPTSTTLKPVSPTVNTTNNNEQYTTTANNYRRRSQNQRGYKDTSFRQENQQQNQQNYNSQKLATNTASTGYNNNYNTNYPTTTTTQKYNYNQQNSNDFRYQSTPTVTTTYNDKTNYYGNNEQPKSTTTNKNYNTNYNTKQSTTTLAPTYNNVYTNSQTTAVNYNDYNQQGNNNNNYYNSVKTTASTNYNNNYNQYNSTNYYNNNNNNNKYTTTESSTNYQTNYYTQPQNNKQQYNTNYNNYNSKVTTTLKPTVQQTTTYTNTFNNNYQTKQQSQNNYYNEKTNAETTQYTQSYTKVNNNQYNNNQYSSTVKPSTTYDSYQNGYYNNRTNTNTNYVSTSTKKYYDYDNSNNYYDNTQYYNTNNYEKATTYNPKGGKTGGNTAADETEILKTAHSINFASGRNNYYNSQRGTGTAGTAATTEKSAKESPRPFSAPTKQQSTTLKSAPKKVTPAPQITNSNNSQKTQNQNDDKSYDYAYYDSNDSHFNDYDNIGTEFSKTSPKSN